MVEAVDANDIINEILEINWDEPVKCNESSIQSKVARVFNATQKATFPSIKIDDDSFYEEIQKAVYDPHLAKLIFAKLQEQGLDTYEKYLGRGAFGKVFQLEGTRTFEGKKLALKLLPYYSDNDYYSYWSTSNKITEEGIRGDALALTLPKGCHLNRAYAVLTFDGKEVHYLEELDPQLHKGHVVIGTLSRAIQGGTLGERVTKMPLSSEAVRGYGKQLAEALLGLHQAGYLHGDLHGGNILVKGEKEGKSPYRIKLTDFGLTHPFTSSDDMRWEWKHFGIILGQMALKTDLEYNSDLNDLLLNPEKGLLAAEFCYTEEAILQHPFFA
ncbi:MAG: protein kinase [Simkaniaceae bacterium]